MSNEKTEAGVFDTFEECARAAMRNVAAPLDRVGWQVWAFESLDGRRPSDLLDQNRNLILFPPVSLAVTRLSTLCLGPPLLKPSDRPARAWDLNIVPAPAPPAVDVCGRGALEVAEAHVVLSKADRPATDFVYDESARAGAQDELHRCFLALSTRGDGLSVRDALLLHESGRLEKREAWTDKAWTEDGWSSEEKRASALSELDGRSPGAVRVSLSRARRKLGERRHKGTERGRRI